MRRVHSFINFNILQNMHGDYLFKFDNDENDQDDIEQFISTEECHKNPQLSRWIENPMRIESDFYDNDVFNRKWFESLPQRKPLIFLNHKTWCA
jgi:hypothetical protein